MPSKLTIIFAQTTLADQPGNARPHSGGWTESFWRSATTPWAGFSQYAAARAAILPKEAAIIGFRQQLYTVQGNRLLPGGSAAFKQIVPGNASYACDIPQMALECSAQGAGVANTAKFTLRAIPDGQVTHGEFTPSQSFLTNLSNFFAYQQSLPNPFGFIGRDLTQIPQKIVSIQGGVLTTSLPLAGVVPTQTWIRILRCKDDSGKPVKGAYLCTATPGSNQYTLQGIGTAVGHANGMARVDALAMFAYSNMSYGRIGVKKIGRPLESYRGRASKRR